MEDKSKDRLRQLSEEMLSIHFRMLGWVDDMLADALNPESLLRFFTGGGIDPSNISGDAGNSSGIDPYRVLGLDRSATDEVVKRRYRELLMKLHPDTAGVEGTEFLLQMVMTAYGLIAGERGWQ